MNALQEALVRYGLPVDASVDVLIRHIEANRELTHACDRRTIDLLTQDALAWRGCAEQLAARLYVLGEASPALDNYERMVEATK